MTFQLLCQLLRVKKHTPNRTLYYSERQLEQRGYSTTLFLSFYLAD